MPSVNIHIFHIFWCGTPLHPHRDSVRLMTSPEFLGILDPPLCRNRVKLPMCGMPVAPECVSLRQTSNLTVTDNYTFTYFQRILNHLRALIISSQMGDLKQGYQDIEALRRRVNELSGQNVQLEDQMKWLQDEVQ